jgi:tRNA(adenine34) deaminase
MESDHVKWMHLALLEAEAAEKIAEVPVGAVLVSSSGELLARAHNETILQSDPTAHAEISVIRQAAKRLKNYRLLNTTLYVTVEPCVMCMGAILHARISRLVFGAADPKWGGCGSICNLASEPRFNHRVDTFGGVCEAEAKRIIQGFFKARRDGALKSTPARR